MNKTEMEERIERLEKTTLLTAKMSKLDISKDIMLVKMINSVSRQITWAYFYIILIWICINLIAIKVW